MAWFRATIATALLAAVALLAPAASQAAGPDDPSLVQRPATTLGWDWTG